MHNVIPSGFSREESAFAKPWRTAHEISSARTHRMERFRNQLWRMGHRWILGQSLGPRLTRRTESSRRLRRQLFRYRRRYGDGRSERLIAQLKKSRKEEIIVATKAGRRLPKQTAEGYS